MSRKPRTVAQTVEDLYAATRSVQNNRQILLELGMSHASYLSIQGGLLDAAAKLARRLDHGDTAARRVP